MGNPGARYQATRHNAGAMVIDELAREAETGAWSFRCHSLVCVANVAGEPALLAKPLTYMNLSGEAVFSLLEECSLDAKQLILVYDDLNLPFGRIRIRERGSAGGHKGMESVIRRLDSDEFIRVRLGIGQEDMPEAKAGFVLSEFTAGQAEALQEMIARAVRAVRCIIGESTSRAMSDFNA